MNDARSNAHATPVDPTGVVASPDDARSRELLDSIFAAPDDEAPRRVYADWLTQRGDPRGELVNLQCDLAALPSAEAPDARGLVERIERFLDEHRRSWSFGVSGVVFERGFVDKVVVGVDSAFSYRELFEHEPIRALSISGGGHGGSVERLMDFRLAALRRLNVRPKLRASGRGLPELLRSQSLAGLRQLHLSWIATHEDVARALLEARHLSSLESVHMTITKRPTLSADTIARLRDVFGPRLVLKTG